MKSRVKLYFLLVLGTSLIAFTSCKDDFFVEKAGDRITPDQHYYTINDANVSMEGAIVLLQDAMPRLIVLEGLRSDEMDITDNSNSYLREINNQVFSKGNPFIDPADLYKIIINVNEVLANLDLVESRDRKFDERTAHQYKGALIGLRSWTYLTLVRMFNQAAYFETSLTELPSNLNQNIMGKQQIIEKLIEDVTPYIHSTTQYEELRIKHYMNTKALLGELYLENGNYAMAAQYLKLACESYLNQPAMLKVDKTYRDAAWGTMFLNAESQQIENISVIPFSRSEQQNNPLATWFGFDRDYLIRPSNIVLDSFVSQVTSAGDTMDVYRIANSIGGEIIYGPDSIVSNINTYIAKYAVDPNDPTSSDIIISRAADIHLMLAEAYNRMADETSQEYALMLLNQGVNKENPKPAEFSKWSGNLGIRGRAYLASRMVPERDSIPLEERTLLIEDLIMSERAMELAFEGKRWTDLVRVAERRNDPAYLADKVAAKFQGTSKYDEIHAKLMNPANWYLPFE